MRLLLLWRSPPPPPLLEAMAVGPGTVLDRATDPSVVAADLRTREGTGSVRDGCNGGASINQLNQIVLVSQSVKNGRRWQLYFSSLLIAKGWKANPTGTEKSGRNPRTKIQSKKQRRGSHTYSDGGEAGREEAIAGGSRGLWFLPSDAMRVESESVELELLPPP